MFKRLRILIVPMLIGSQLAIGQSTTPPPAPSASAAVAKSDHTFTQEELDQLLAPIALYPDSVLSQALMATTYPLEIVQAQRWIDARKTLKGDALATELEKQTWDPSVKSLVNFPQILTMMSEKLDWTIQLGNAFLSQQKDVMDTVQKLRGKAEAAGNLKTTSQQTVRVDGSGTTQTIVIESANPQVIYVPVYDPTIIYGTWWYPSYPPYYYYPPAYRPGPGIAFGVGLAIGVAWGYAWGHCDWHHTNIDIDINRNININTRIDRTRYQADFNRTNVNIGGKSEWQHNPAHRGGTPYPNKTTSQQFGRQASPARDTYRGFDNQNLDANRGQLNSIDRPNLGSPSNLGNPSRDFNRTNSPTNLPSNVRANPGATMRQDTSGSRGSAFQGVNSGATQTRIQSQRGHSSSGGSISRGGGGGARGGGGGRR